MPIQKIYAKGPQLLANYSITDIINGVAYELLYPGAPGILLSSGGGVLRNFVFGSSDGDGTARSSFNPDVGGAYVKALDIDFDLDVGRTIVMEGTALFTFHYSVQTAGKTYDFYLKFRIMKVDDDGEHEIASGNSSVEIGTTAAAIEYFNTGGIVVVPRAVIKNGEKIRLIIESWSKDSTAGTTIIVGHDPANVAVAGSLTSSIMKLWLPFKVEI